MVGNTILIVGVGNSLRGDDGAGLLLATSLHKALQERGIAAEVRLVQQLLPELAEEIGEISPCALVFADCAAGVHTGQVRRMAQPGGTAWAQPALAGHSLAPGQLLALAQRLYGFAGAAWLATVPGTDFSHGEGVSLAVQTAVAGLVPLVVAYLQ